jgi:hypothetical protein
MRDRAVGPGLISATPKMEQSGQPARILAFEDKRLCPLAVAERAPSAWAGCEDG